MEMQGMSIHDQRAVLAAQQNPFVEDKPYNPNEVAKWIILHLNQGQWPSTKEGEEFMTHLYATTLDVLLSNNYPVTEESIAKLKDEIIQAAAEPATPAIPESGSQPATAKKETPCSCQAKKGQSFGFWLLIGLLVLLFIKIIKS